MAFSIGPGLYILAAIFMIPWAIVIGVAFLARTHFQKFMVFYIGGAFAIEMIAFVFLFGL